MKKKLKIAFQGEEGAYSHIVSLELFPDAEIKACPTFDETFQFAKESNEHKIVIPIENSLAGRVADIHYLIPNTNCKYMQNIFKKLVIICLD